jgi:hypothetical protein
MNPLTEVAAAVVAALKSPELLKEIYGDLLKPGVKQVGIAVEKILRLPNIALWRIDLWESRSGIALQANLEAYRVEMSKVADEKVLEVPPELGVPVMEKLAYVSDAELSSLYVALLASASNLDTSDSAHPAFVNIINCLSPDEGRLLLPLAQGGRIAFVDGQIVDTTNGSHWSIRPLMVPEALTAPLIVKKNLAAYLGNLEGLGIVKVGTDQWLTADEPYEPMSTEFMKTLVSLGPTQKLNAQRGMIEVTPYGHLFMRGCKVLERLQAQS